MQESEILRRRVLYVREQALVHAYRKFTLACVVLVFIFCTRKSRAGKNAPSLARVFLSENCVPTSKFMIPTVMQEEKLYRITQYVCPSSRLLLLLFNPRNFNLGSRDPHFSSLFAHACTRNELRTRSARMHACVWQV